MTSPDELDEFLDEHDEFLAEAKYTILIVNSL